MRAALAVVLVLLAAGCTSAPAQTPTSSGPTTPSLPAAVTATAPSFGPNTLLGGPDVAGIAGEPSIATGPDGTIYVSAPVIPASSLPGAEMGQPFGQGRVWRSTDNGSTFKLLNDANGWLDASKKQPGDGDTDIAVDASGRVHFIDLGSGIPYLTSDDHGGKWTDRGSLSRKSTNVDRQWIAIDNETVAATWNDFDLGGATVTVSTDAGGTWTKPTRITQDNQWEGPIVVAPGGLDMYIAIVDGTTGHLAVMASHDRGAKWAPIDTAHSLAKPAQANPGYGTILSAQSFLFPVLSVDREGNLFLVWSQYTGDPTGTTAVSWMRSTDRGATWKEMGEVSSGEANAVFPWAVAGDNGRLGVVYLTSDLPIDPTYGPHQWHLEARVTGDALADKPSFASALVTPDVVHVGAICPNGGGCGAIVDPAYGDRSLLDFLECTITPDGHLVAAWTETHEGKGRDPEIHFARQANGTLLVA